MRFAFRGLTIGAGSRTVFRTESSVSTSSDLIDPGFFLVNNRVNLSEQLF